jgi:hypothetical protein
MLFSIYSASLIALSSAMRVGSPAGQTDCKLSVAVDGVGMGWVQATEDDILTTTGTESKTFEDGTLFKYGVGKENGSFRVVYIIHIPQSRARECYYVCACANTLD